MQVIPAYCNRRGFSPPKSITFFSTCSHLDHLVSGQIIRTRVLNNIKNRKLRFRSMFQLEQKILKLITVTLLFLCVTFGVTCYTYMYTKVMLCMHFTGSCVRDTEGEVQHVQNLRWSASRAQSTVLPSPTVQGMCTTFGVTTYTFFAPQIFTEQWSLLSFAKRQTTVLHARVTFGVTYVQSKACDARTRTTYRGNNSHVTN